MEHYICTGSCQGVSEVVKSCDAEGCSKQGEPLTSCNCEDMKHGAEPQTEDGVNESVPTE
ncbi:MAG: hypothetical protein AAB903_02830 [Patescibacteria group bacterium]